MLYIDIAVCFCFFTTYDMVSKRSGHNNSGFYTVNHYGSNINQKAARKRKKMHDTSGI